MSPKTMDRYLGIELEFHSKYNKTYIRRLLSKFNLKEYVDVGYDGSIKLPKVVYSKEDTQMIQKLSYLQALSYDYTGRREAKIEAIKSKYERYRIELRILVKQSQYKLILQRVQKLLLTIDAQVNSSCGMHVHIDMRNRKVGTTLSKLFDNQELLFTGPNRSRKTNRFCRPLTKRELNNFLFGNNIPGDRRRAINLDALTEHNTIEIRAFAGTVDMKQAKKNIQTVLSIIK